MMMFSLFRPLARWLIPALLIAACAVVVVALANAQDSEDDKDDFTLEPIEITATVTDIEDGIAIVGGLPVDISTITLPDGFAPGIVITVNGVINEVGVITPATIIVLGLPTPTPYPTDTETPRPEATSTPEATATPQATITIEGPVTSVNANTITIQNINVVIAPNNPILNLIRVGDIIRVEGVSGPNGITAVVVNTVINAPNVAPGATVSVQGPIEAINGNLITVNGILIQLDRNDPRLPTLQVGNFVDVQGNFVLVNNSFVLVGVNLVIINNSFVGIPPYCRWHGMSGMGHWRCEGYWLYPPNFWYCEWRAMGMGRWECREPIPAMGMGGMGMGMGMGMGG